MTLNEDYFKDLEITDEDIIEDDVEEPEHELTVEEFHKLPEQYNQVISFRITVYDDSDITFLQTSLLPRICKRLDTIFELYGIEHSEYIFTTGAVEDCETIIEFGDYQLFCEEGDEDKFINITFDEDGEPIFITVYVNYPKFNYKRAFRFLYTMLNLYKIYEQINWMDFEPITTNDYELTIWNSLNYIYLSAYDKKWHLRRTEITLDRELREKDKIDFYNSVFCHFFGERVLMIDYKVIDRDVPFKHL